VKCGGSVRASLSGGPADSGCGYVFARKNAVPEAAIHPENLVVSKTRLESKLGDHIGRRIEGVVCLVVIQAARYAGSSYQEIGGVVVGGQGSLRLFRRNREPNFVAEVLCQAHTILPRPGETDGVLR